MDYFYDLFTAGFIVIINKYISSLGWYLKALYETNNMSLFHTFISSYTCKPCVHLKQTKMIWRFIIVCNFLTIKGNIGNNP